ncbi:3-keto-L-gulonate-6-phosphate decarboxylase sgbH [Yersinia intermedia]|uniref:3-dehydro-L-gulonate-6-phosphate decarboxylase n=1 Tax=Yersinia intermedia TaxID=631 RepID=A0A0H5LRG9_YERIN|nr:3-keto-L-gulonate-6-phosphate decarboxylase UlaD [Yersinia intermedia]CRY53659.1 3-keto-L-gulonate-6-phosphate decarboxylase sgbH [Yersinia intermedia]
MKTPHARPQLQLALDHTSLDAALATTAQLHPHVDIIEAGTILCISEGIQAVRAMRKLYPQHTLVADLKVADAGATLAQLAFSAGANWMTVICAAPLATMDTALDVAKQYGGDIQIELFGHWTLQDAKNWRDLGLKQAIYHRGRDAQASGQNWGQADLERMQALSDLGIELSVTGGITPADLPLFHSIAVRAFIVGRALSEAEQPVAVATAFHHAIDATWGK